MNKYQSAALRSFRRIREFLSAHAPADATPAFTKKVQELDDVMAAMANEANEQNTGTRLGAIESQRQRALREALWDDHMAPIAELARSIYGVPGVKEALKLPRKNADNDRLLAAASGMANAAESDKAVFVGHGMKEDFVEQLRAATKALADQLVVRVQTGRRRVKATSAVEEQVQRGARAVTALNALLRSTLKRNRDLRAAWRNAKARSDQGGGGAATLAVAQAQPATQSQGPAPDTTKAA